MRRTSSTQWWLNGLLCLGLLAGSPANAQSPASKAMLINKTDLAALGCEVASDNGTYIQRPGTKILNFRNKRGCVVNVTTSVVMLSQAKESADELWQKLAENNEHRARKCKCTPVRTPGTIGERSELTVFPGEGDNKGFRYAVQDRGFLYEVTLYSEQVTMSPALEALVAAKIDLLATHVSAEPAS